MRKIILSFILSVAAFASASADGYTGVLVTNGDQKTCYLFEEQPTIRRKVVDGVMNACLYIEGKADPVVSVPLKNGAKLSTNFTTFTRVNLNSAGYATFSCKDASSIATNGVTAYKAAVGDELITLTPLEGNIPAGNGVILYANNAETKVDLPVANSGNDADMTGNILKPTTLADGSLAEIEDDSWELGDDALFHWFTGAAYTPNSAYLVHAVDDIATLLSIIFADDPWTTDIKNTVSDKSVREGKYIENGNIVIIKNGMKYNIAGQPIK